MDQPNIATFVFYLLADVFDAFAAKNGGKVRLG
jgi:hypothetical protein